MTNKNEANEMFSYLAKNNEISVDKLTQIYTSVYKSIPNQQPYIQPLPPSKPLTKSEFESKLNQAINQKTIEDELLLLFYNIDKDKKGYLTPEDIMGVFNIMDKPITINEIQNSFKYVKVYKNKMTFEDFKEYFYNF